MIMYVCLFLVGILWNFYIHRGNGNKNTKKNKENDINNGDKNMLDKLNLQEKRLRKQKQTKTHNP